MEIVAHLRMIRQICYGTLKSGAKKPGLEKVLCENRCPNVEGWMNKFDLDWSLVARPSRKGAIDQFNVRLSLVLRFGGHFSR